MSASRTPVSFGAVLLAGLLAVAGPLAAVEAGAAPGPTGRTGTLSPRLQALSAQVTASTSEAAADRIVRLPADGPGSLLRADDGALRVNARLRRVDGATERLLARAGAAVVARSAPDRLVTLEVAAPDLGGLATLPDVEWVEEVLEPAIHRTSGEDLRRALAEGGVTTSASCGSRITSEADAQLGGAAARATYGVDGTGVRVGILSDSYDDLGGAAADVAGGELPGPTNPCGRTTPVTVRADLGSGGSDEGRAMAQAVHDLAPGAAISFATAFVSDVDFANQIRGLAADGAQVIVDDISYFNEPIYQDGIIAKAVADVTAAGVTYFSSAGNGNVVLGGREVGSYEAAAYRPAACPPAVATLGNVDCHDLDPGAGTDVGNGLTLSAGGQLVLKLGWSQPQHGITTDLDLFLVDAVTGGIVARGVVDNVNSSRQAYEVLSYTNSTGVSRTFDLVVSRYEAVGGTPRFKTIILERSSLTAVQFNLSNGTDVVGPTGFGHNLSSAAGSIAAIRHSSSTAPETFSSRGPATSCWNPVAGTTAATALPACVVDHLDVTATDGAANSFFGQLVSGTWRFYGTSQAAPHAAAVAALQVAARPCRTPAEVLAAQRSSADPIGAFGPDAVGGGLLDAPGAIAALASCPTVPGAPTAVSGTAGDGEVSLSWSAPASDGGAAITGYVVTPSVGGVAQPPRVLASSATSQVVAGLANGTTYAFTVAATNARGTGAASDASAPVTPVAPSAPAVPWAPFTSWGTLVDRLYADLLDRAPTGGERSTEVGRLAAETSTPGALVTGLRLGDEHVGNVDTVARLYRAYFLRTPDSSGFGYWLRQRRAGGRRLAAISATFAASSEFRNRYGTLGDRAFVELVYRNVLNREGDPAGVAHWTGRLAAGRAVRGQVMLNFSESNEYRTAEAAAVETSVQHLLLLGRAPSASELSYLVGELQAGRLTPAGLAGQILSSPAYATRVAG